MHELSITEGILNTALNEARRSNAAKITGIVLGMGQLSSVVPECVQEYFDMLSEDTIAYGAKLTFNYIPAVLKCRECNNRFPLKHMRLICPACNSQKVEIVEGREFYIDRLEVELPE